MKKQVSFIIPVYNVEPYVRQCLDSVLACGRFGISIEILLVIGKSTDKSDKICRQYAKNHAEIRLIEQEKIGLSNARNCGLRQAEGMYICFVDGDDFLKPESFQKKIPSLAKPIDILVSDYEALDHADRIYRISAQIDEEMEAHSDEAGWTEFVLKRGSFWNVWRYIYRREFLEEKGLYFLEDTKSEDVLFTIQAFCRADHISFSHVPYYCYRARREGALTTQIDFKHVKDFLQVLEKSMKELEQNRGTREPHFLNGLREKLRREYILNFPYLYEVPKSERSAVKDLLDSYLWMLRESPIYMIQILYRWCAVFGIRIPAKCLDWIKHGRRRVTHTKRLSKKK